MVGHENHVQTIFKIGADNDAEELLLMNTYQSITIEKNIIQ